jgi:hypothetical protein
MDKHLYYNMKFTATIKLDSDLDKALRIAELPYVDLYDNIFILSRRSNIYTCKIIVDLIPLFQIDDIEVVGYTSN